MKSTKKTKQTKNKKTKKPTKAKKKTVAFTDAQIDVIVKKFYEHSRAKILDMVFDSSQELVDEMLDFVAQRIANELKFPATDKDFEDKVIDIMKENAGDMSQDLIFNQVSALMKEDIIPAAAKEFNEFNEKRGL